MHRSYFFVRHARAVYQDRGFDVAHYPKDTDWPLSPRGAAQARMVAPWLLRSGVERIVSSALLRARVTAETLAEETGLPHEHAWPELNEVSPRRLFRADRSRLGRWPIQLGRRVEWWHALRVVRAMQRQVAGGSPAPYDLAPIHERVREVLTRLDAMREPRIAVVSHGYFILLSSLAVGGTPRTRWIDNCSVTRIDADGRGGYRLITFATPRHLLGTAMEP